MVARTLTAFATVAALAVSAAPALAKPKAETSKTFTMSAAEATRRVNRFLTAYKIRPDGASEPGVIRARGPSDQGEWVTCRARKGELRAISFDITIMIDGNRRGGSTVTILVDGDAINARRNRFLFIPTTIEKTPIDCDTSGRMERIMFDYLSQN